MSESELTPNEMVVKALMRFLYFEGVGCLNGNSYAGFYVGDYSNPRFEEWFSNFYVQYVGERGEVMVSEMGSGAAPKRCFAIADPDCFDQVLEMVR